MKGSAQVPMIAMAPVSNRSRIYDDDEAIRDVRSILGTGTPRPTVEDIAMEENVDTTVDVAIQMR